MAETLIIAGTGHRPEELGGYGAVAMQRLICLAEEALVRLRPTEVISGMALGWDQALASAALKLKFPLIAAVPFKGQESVWPPSSQQEYRALLKQATRVEIVCKGSYAPWKMQKRNMWMVDHCDLVLALHNGAPGGTGNCIKYAEEVKKPIENLWPKFLEKVSG